MAAMLACRGVRRLFNVRETTRVLLGTQGRSSRPLHKLHNGAVSQCRPADRAAVCAASSTTMMAVQQQRRPSCQLSVHAGGKGALFAAPAQRPATLRKESTRARTTRAVRLPPNSSVASVASRRYWWSLPWKVSPA